jgi:hypothetical protein
MNKAFRLEDLLPDWRDECRGKITDWTTQLSDRATVEFPADEVAISDKTQRQVQMAVSDPAQEFVADDLLASSLDLLKAQGLVEPSITGRVREEVGTSLRLSLPAFHPFLPPSTARIPYASWALFAAAGAILGCFVSAELGVLLSSPREPWLFIGGAVGAGLSVGLLAWLSQRPEVLNVLEKLAALASGLTGIAGVLRMFRGQSFGLLKAAGWFFGGWLLLRLARARLKGPTRDQVRETLRPQINAYLVHGADLVLALCWAHPARSGFQSATSTASSLSIPIPLITALGVLDDVSRDGRASPAILHTAILAVIQRARADGYDWESVPAGTSYYAALATKFECFDSIEIGRPVEMLEPALIRKGEVVKPGLLRSL